VRARGTKLGRPSRVGEDTRKLIRSLRGAGLSWKKVADALTDQGIPTGQGGAWHASTVRRIYQADPLAKSGM